MRSLSRCFAQQLGNKPLLGGYNSIELALCKIDYFFAYVYPGLLLEELQWGDVGIPCCNRFFEFCLEKKKKKRSEEHTTHYTIISPKQGFIPQLLRKTSTQTSHSPTYSPSILTHHYLSHRVQIINLLIISIF
eukprot:TRINITY_DN11315_c0_g1_i1.p3 TRINITY_DN11315_c0_g1~~TRINITY_DN11315_c0_g1_i1.p3  ORF type:complete len:133 (-),score=4.19 TRINITY_DN11315_c0_g1_i1:145-543(-)